MKRRLCFTINKILLLLFLFPGFISCKRSLDLKPVSVLSTGNAYNSAQDIENALVGAYSIFYQEYYIWDNVLLGDVRSDNAYVGGGGDPGVVPYELVTISGGIDPKLRFALFIVTKPVTPATPAATGSRGPGGSLA